MQIVHIDHRNAELQETARKIVVCSNGHRKATIPMRLVERLVITSTANITTSLLLKLNRQGTGVLVLPGRYSAGRPVHIVPAKTDIHLAHAQLRLAAGLNTALPLAKHFIEAKLRGHRFLLDELAETHLRHQRILKQASQQIHRAIENLSKPVRDKDQLRGMEGAAQAQFFRAWGHCFASSLKFSTRNRRPRLIRSMFACPLAIHWLITRR